MSVETPTRTRTSFIAVKHGGREPQEDFYQCREFYPLYYGGVGIGKTRALLVDFLEFAAEHPGSRQIVTEPTWQMVRDIMIPTIEDCYGTAVGSRFEMTRQPPVDIKFPNSSQVWLRSTDVRPERLYGPNVARVGMDEVTLGHQEEARNILTQRCRQPGYLHQLKATGTPKGRNWVWRDYIDRRIRGSATFFAETADAERAGLLPPGYVARLLDTYGGWDNPLARQELGGQFLALAGQVFPQFSRETHVRALDLDPVTFKQRLGGIDFGGVSPTALVAMGLGGDARAWAFDEWYKHEASEDDLVAAMAEMEQRTGVRRWLADPSGKKPMEKLRNAGFDVSPARHGNDLKLRVRLMGARLNLHAKLPGLYVTPQCPNLITEMETLLWQRVKLQGAATEILNDAFERGCPDHAVDAATNVLAEWDEGMPEVPRDFEESGLFEREW